MKYILTITVMLTLFVSCKKELQADKDDKIIQEYIAAKSIAAIKTSSGLYYKIINEGTGTRPVATSDVQVNYKGYLTDSTVFDQSTAPQIFDLQSLIKGWQEGIPYIKEGGSILLLVPSKLGYGDRKVGSIPANSVLIFEIDLLDVL